MRAPGCRQLKSQPPLALPLCAPLSSARLSPAHSVLPLTHGSTAACAGQVAELRLPHCLPLKRIWSHWEESGRAGLFLTEERWKQTRGSFFFSSLFGNEVDVPESKVRSFSLLFFGCESLLPGGERSPSRIWIFLIGAAQLIPPV